MRTLRLSLLLGIGAVVMTAQHATASPLLLVQIVDVSSGFKQQTTSAPPLSLSDAEAAASASFFSVGAPVGLGLAASAEADWSDQPMSEPETLMLLGTGAVFGASGWRRRHAQARRIGRSTECFQPAPAAWAQPRPAFNSQEL